MNDASLNALHANPDDWPLRCSLAKRHYDSGQYDEAAALINEAPAIPEDANNIRFAATLLAATDAAGARSMVEKFVSSHGSTPELEELRTYLGSESPPRDQAAEPHPRPTPAPAEEITSSQSTDQPAAAVPVAVVPAHEPATPVVVEEEAPEEDETGADDRALAAGEGEAVHAAEQAPDTKDKLNALLVAVAVHLVLFFSLGYLVVTAPPRDPPRITVSSTAPDEESTVEKNTLTREKRKSASAVSTSAPVMSSTAFSDFSVPDTVETGQDLSMVAMSDSDAGFGMSMSGFGSVSNMGAIPEGMRSRCSMSQRMKRLRESGGEDRAERAVRDGLEFLAGRQDPESGAFGETYPAGMTGLALLAYLGHCETPESARFGDVVVNAALYLMNRCLENDGRITNGDSGHHEIYEHGIATYALAELYTMTKESGNEIPRLDSVLRKAVGVIVDAQMDGGGWSYGFSSEKGEEDMSVSGWQIQALKAAHNSGRNFPGLERALDDAVEEYLPSIQDSDGAFKYRPKDARGKKTLTGAALLGMQIWKGADSDVFERGFGYLRNQYTNPSPGANYYAPYYNTQVFFLHEGKPWEEYNEQFQPRLLDAQNADGSWLSEGGRWDDYQIMNTAWAILMLEVYYRYLPTTDKVEGLGSR